MQILIFTEGTIIMPLSFKDLTREERVKKSQEAGIQREEQKLAYESNATQTPKAEFGSVYDFENHIPVGNAVQKVQNWDSQGAEIIYLTSRRIKSEIDAVRQVLKKYGFPNVENLFFRKQGEDYKDVAERLIPDVLIEDDCESIGGTKQMTSTFIKPEIKRKIKSVVVKEFQGIDDLPDKIKYLSDNF